MIFIMSWFHRFVTTYPSIVLAIITVLCTFTTYVSFTGKALPSFEDPQLGFETRGTEISQRVVAWDKLMEESRISGSLVFDPNEILNKQRSVLHREKRFAEEDNRASEAIDIRNNSHEVDEGRTKKKSRRKKNKGALQQLKELQLPQQNQESDLPNYVAGSNFFCDEVQPGYAQLVFSAKENANVFSYEAIMELCNFQTVMERLPNYMRHCLTSNSGDCCSMWSLPNFITHLLTLPDCTRITREAVNGTLSLLKGCSKYYREGKLSPRYKGTDVPEGCVQNRASVYAIMQYIADVDFLLQDQSGYLRDTSLFLPITKNFMTLELYHDMEPIVKYESDILKITAMDIGVKYLLFDEYLIRDIRFLSGSVVFIVICAWAYTGCIFLTFLTMSSIFLSLINAYFIYTFVLGLQFFPFMNMLAVIVSLGIGSDDAYIICKVWEHTRKENPELSKLEMVYLVVKHSAVAVFVTTLTTVAAFMSSFGSSVTAVKCFSVFAGLATLINYIFMITWILSGIVISCEWRYIPFVHWSFTRQVNVYQSILNMKSSFDQYIVECVEKYSVILITVFGCVSAASVFAVLVWPRLQVPDSNEFQLLEKKHPFEQYDLVYRDRFRFSQAHSEENSWDKLPLRFVWGVEPVDTGSYLDPADRGSLHLDPTFDMASAESQEWLLKFCRRLRAQPFNHVISGPALSNCFIETFKTWMNRECVDAVDNQNYYPCCNNVSFPYPRRVFNVCVLKAMASIFSVDSFLSSDVAGPRFLRNSTRKTPKIKAVVVEFVSNMSYTTSFDAMNTFYQQVEAWTRAEMRSAPAGMKNGWFISHVAFYDLQRTLVQDTSFSILISMSVALLVLLGVTLNVPLSLIAILTITCIIFVSVSVLILFGWKLNILESIAISLSIGLSVDFSLHYAVNYKLSVDKTSRRASVVHALSMMAMPSLMAAVTTGASGVFMLPSVVLPYIQIGLFLSIISSVSWIFATFFQMPLLYRYGPENDYGQFSYAKLKTPFTALRRRFSKQRDADDEVKEETSCDSLVDRRSVPVSNETGTMLEMENMNGHDESRMDAEHAASVPESACPPARSPNQIRTRCDSVSSNCSGRDNSWARVRSNGLGNGFRY